MIARCNFIILYFIRGECAVSRLMIQNIITGLCFYCEDKLTILFCNKWMVEVSRYFTAAIMCNEY